VQNRGHKDVDPRIFGFFKRLAALWRLLFLVVVSDRKPTWLTTHGADDFACEILADCVESPPDGIPLAPASG
jgi:hypothetical protein